MTDRYTYGIFSLLTLMCVGCVPLFYLSGKSDFTLHPVSDLSHSDSVTLNSEERGSIETRSKRNVSSRLTKDERKIVAAKLSAIATAIILAPNISQPCKDGWEYLLTYNQSLGRDDALFGTTTLAIRAIDASGKPGAGILEGNLYAYGSYDECLETDHTQYCIASLSYSQHVFQPIYKLGVCVPQECSNNDVVLTAKNLIAAFGQDGVIPNMDMSSNANEVHCETEHYPPYTTGAVIMILICYIFISAAVVGTVVDGLSQTLHIHTLQAIEKTSAPCSGNHFEKASQGTHKVALYVITSFSLIKNVSSILSTKQPSFAIPSLNGIRVISMFWIILLHTVFLVVGEADNQLYIHNHVIHHYTFLVCGNIAFPVDTFFFLSGLLASYITLRKMATKNGRFSILRHYLHRYLRITPTVAFMLFFYWFLSMHLSDGPEYQATTGLDSPRYQNCEKYWWTHLLFINNFYPNSTASECFKETWYLSTDMQFYLLSPLIIVLLYNNCRLGFISVGLILLCSFAATAVLVACYGFDASYPGLLFLDMLQLVNRQRPVRYTSKPIYSQPFTRISPYLVGIVLGYLFYTKTTIPYKHILVKRAIYIVLWALAASVCISVLHGVYGSHPLTLVENILYFTFSRFAWSIGLALMVFACHNGYGWVMNSFLSMKLWFPLSRLTFTAYLVHPIIIGVICNHLRGPLHYTGITLMVHVVSVVVLSYGSAGLVGAFVEFPMSNLEVIMFKQIDLWENRRQVEQDSSQVEMEGIRLLRLPMTTDSLLSSSSPAEWA